MSIASPDYIIPNSSSIVNLASRQSFEINKGAPITIGGKPILLETSLLTQEPP
jgi:hypothetical protein